MSPIHSQEFFFFNSKIILFLNFTFYHTFVIFQILFYGLNCIPQIYMLNFKLPVLQNVTVLRDRLFKELIKLK